MAATLLVAVSCNETPAEVEQNATVAVSATLENGREWEQGAEVVINNSKYTVEVGGKSTITIENVTAADYYYAAYDFGSGTIDGTKLTVDIPALQGSAISMIQPMVASNGNTNLVFKNLLGRLRLSLLGSGKILRATLTSTDSALAGSGVVDMNFAGAPVLDMSADGSRTITVDLGQGVTLPADVEFSLPASSYSGLALTLYGENDEIMSGVVLPATEIVRGEVATAELTYKPDAEAPTYITATLENDAEGVANVWAASSVLYVNGVPAQLAGGQGSGQGEFGPLSTAQVYYVSTSSASANGVSGDAMRVSIPLVQKFNAPLATLNPAVAKSTTNSVALTYLAGVVSAEVKGPHILRRVTLSGKNNRRLAGAGVADLSTTTARLSLGSDASKDVVVDCGTAGVNIEAGATFRFVLPAENYSEGFTLTMEDNNGQTYSTELAGVAVERNKIAQYKDIVWQSAAGDNNNLSKLGYANCYMVHMAGDYTFSTRLVDNTPVNNIANVDWLWMTSENLISNISYADGTISFTASEAEGNALIAAFNAAGEIVWSWHIWLTDKPELFDYQNNTIPMSNGQTDGYYCMDRNLGATDTALGRYESFGLYYQWGRKDPFIGDKAEERKRDVESGGWVNVVSPFANSATITICNTKYEQAAWVATPSSEQIGSIEYAVQHPMTFLSADPNGNKPNWVNKNNLGSEKNNILYDADKSLWRPFQKSNYDPCPVGYQVPRKAMWVSLVSTNCVHTEYLGFVNTTDAGQSVNYPSAGYRSAHPSDAGALVSVQNDTGFVKLWSSEMEVAETAYSFTFNYPMYNAATGAGWGNGYNVRCVKAY